MMMVSWTIPSCLVIAIKGSNQCVSNPSSSRVWFFFSSAQGISSYKKSNFSWYQIEIFDFISLVVFYSPQTNNEALYYGHGFRINEFSLCYILASWMRADDSQPWTGGVGLVLEVWWRIENIEERICISRMAIFSIFLWIQIILFFSSGEVGPRTRLPSYHFFKTPKGYLAPPEVGPPT